MTRPIPRLAPVTKATLPPEDSYGERDESRVVQAPVADLPPGVAPGARVHAQLPNGGTIFMTVVSIDGPTATLDANHPLAGTQFNQYHMRRAPPFFLALLAE